MTTRKTSLQSNLTKGRIADLSSLADAYAFVRHSLCELYQWPFAAAHVTRQSATASVSWHHGSSSEHCCIVFF